MTEEFLRECHRAVLAGMRAGIVTFPPMQPEPEPTPRRSNINRPCADCGVVIAIRSPWHLRCETCAPLHARAQKRARKSSSNPRKNS